MVWGVSRSGVVKVAVTAAFGSSGLGGVVYSCSDSVIFAV